MELYFKFCLNNIDTTPNTTESKVKPANTRAMIIKRKSYNSPNKTRNKLYQVISKESIKDFTDSTDLENN
ncbi:hypothetical protein IHI24_000409 [Rickettsia endosymbiont of Cardiosporidium cionae]|nr:hypothetical protein IHI24_000409 [Rickettsia endosymbiont of Cardiosporidium cionae]